MHEEIIRTDAVIQQRSNRLLYEPVRPIVVPLWLGAERRGVELGGREIEIELRGRWDLGERPDLAGRLLCADEVAAAAPNDADTRLHRRTLEFRKEIADINQRLSRAVRHSIERGELPVILGGDHSLATGSIHGAMQATEKLGVLWFDTHGDVNSPETSPTGHIHGMPLALALGYGPPDLLIPSGEQGLSPEAVCLLGIRDLDPGERRFIAEQDIWMLTMEEWSDVGLVAGLDAALEHLVRNDVTAVHLSFDLDVLDPLELPGTGTPVPGGLTYRETSQILRHLRDWNGPLHSVDWVELNPVLDPTGRSTTVAVSLLATLLGEKIR